MHVAILTMFTGLSTTYSLVNVVQDQIQMLLHGGMEISVLVSDTCRDEERWGSFAHPDIHWVKVKNTWEGKPLVWHDYSQGTGKVHDTFYQEVDWLAEDLVRCLQGVDVCIVHDILYQGWHLIHNVALRKAQPQLPGLRFLAFNHSLPVTRPKEIEEPFSARFTPMPNTVYVYPTYSGLEALAQQYQVPIGQCGVVYNTLPLLETISKATQTVAHHADLLRGEIVMVYPARLTPGKRFEKVAALAGCMERTTGKEVRVVFCDFPCADIPPEVYKNTIRREGERHGLPTAHLVFTSDLGYPYGFPRASVLELFTLSNLFVSPSYSESFGLTVLEAASRGNYLVLNQAVPALKELGERLGAYFLRWDARNFGFDTREEYHPSEQAYYEEHAAIIVQNMEQDTALRAKTRVRTAYNLEWIYEQQLLPLLQRKS